MVTTVPFIDLTATAAEIWTAVESKFKKSLLKAEFVAGAAIPSFEERWAEYCGARYAVGVASGTDALELTLTALGIGRGDEVVVPATTFVATAAAVVRVGAVPRFADVDANTLLITANTLAAAATSRTRAVIVVHLYGQPADMTTIMAKAHELGIFLVEDAAQAHGAEWQGQRAGSFGIAGCFSFYPSKNLGAFGEAGAVVTSDLELAERIRQLANHGRATGTHYEHVLLGWNGRLDNLQALVLEAGLDLLDGWTERRIALACQYSRRLEGAPGIRLVGSNTAARHVYHLMVVRVPQRDLVRRMLREWNIETGIHYPVPCHKQPPLASFAAEPLPASEDAAAEVLSLPLYPHLTPRQVDYVCDRVVAISAFRSA